MQALDFSVQAGAILLVLVVALVVVLLLENNHQQGTIPGTRLILFSSSQRATVAPMAML
jgi:hypothetical protein